MYKQNFISALKSSKNSMDKIIARGGFAVSPGLRYHEDQKFLRRVTDYNLSEIRRHIRVLRNAVEIHLPNVDEVVRSITKTEIDNANIRKDLEKLNFEGLKVFLMTQQSQFYRFMTSSYHSKRCLLRSPTQQITERLGF